jgi:hypothetical protein
MIMRFLLTSLLALLGFSCAKKPEPTTQMVPPASLKPGPIQHSQLTEDQVERIKKFREVFADIDELSLETWMDNFKRDLDPDKEIAIWEHIAGTYQSYCSERVLSKEAKKEVQSILLLRSLTASEEEVLKLSKLKLLSAEEAEKVIRRYSD